MRVSLQGFIRMVPSVCLIQGACVCVCVWVCANVKCLCVGWDKARVERYIKWMCGFRLWLSRQNLWDWNLFLGPRLFTTFIEGFTRPRGEWSPQLCSSLMKVVCGLSRKLLTSPTFILSKMCTSWMWLGSCLTPSKFLRVSVVCIDRSTPRGPAQLLIYQSELSRFFFFKIL